MTIKQMEENQSNSLSKMIKNCSPFTLSFSEIVRCVSLSSLEFSCFFQYNKYQKEYSVVTCYFFFKSKQIVIRRLYSSIMFNNRRVPILVSSDVKSQTKITLSINRHACQIFCIYMFYLRVRYQAIATYNKYMKMLQFTFDFIDK